MKTTTVQQKMKRSQLVIKQPNARLAMAAMHSGKTHLVKSSSRRKDAGQGKAVLPDQKTRKSVLDITIFKMISTSVAALVIYAMQISAILQ